MKKLIFLILIIVALCSCKKEDRIHTFEKGEYTGTEFADCYSCHYDDYRYAYIDTYLHIELIPNTECKECHTTYSWNGN